MIKYAWRLNMVSWHTNWLNRVEDPSQVHLDWNGAMCDGTFVYAHNHSYFPHIAWWECSLCTRKVCGYRPEALFQAVAKVVNG